MRPTEQEEKESGQLQNEIPEEEIIEEPRPRNAVGRTFREELTFLIPNREYWVMQLLMYVNIGIWIIMVITGTDVIDPTVEDIVKWGGNIDILTLGYKEYWRLFTSCFIHIGIVHLLFNMYALLYIGSLLEHVIGHKRFLFAYIVTGLISSLASLWWNNDIISAGASGAIFGMYGLYIALLLSGKLLDKKQQKLMLTSMLVFVVYNLVYGLKENIDNAGHIGGLVSGLIVGACFLPSLLRVGNRMFSKIAEYILPLVLLVGIFFMVKSDAGESDGGGFDEELIEILFYLDKSAELMNDVSEDMPEEYVIDKLRTFILYMDSCQMIIADYPDRYNMDEQQERLITYFDAFTGLKKEFALTQIEYIKSGFSGEYEDILRELIYEMEKLNAEYESQ